MPKIFFYIYWKSMFLCVIIFVLSSVTFRSIPEAARFQYSDKLTHALMYVALGFVAYYEYSKDTVFKIKHPLWFVWMILFFVFFGGIIEILQGTVFRPRTSELADWVADVAGLALGFGVGKLLFGKKYK